MDLMPFADILAVLVISRRITTSIPGNLTRIGRICGYTCANGMDLDVLCFDHRYAMQLLRP